jgi:phage terminase large subunit-like protein
MSKAFPIKQDQRDRKQDKSKSNMLTQHLFNILTQTRVRRWCRIVCFRENIRNVVVNRMLPI